MTISNGSTTGSSSSSVSSASSASFEPSAFVVAEPVAVPAVEEIVVPQAISDAAVAKMAARIAALGETDLAPTNRDPQRAADIVLRALPALEAQRGLLEATYKVFDFGRLDSLKDAAYAAKYHNGSAHAAPEEEDVLRAALEKATTTRDEMNHGNVSTSHSNG